jgi:cold shock CspA family protein
MPISDAELRRRTLVASGRYDAVSRLLDAAGLSKLLIAFSKAGVEDSTIDDVGLATLNEFEITANNPGERILLLEALRARLARHDPRPGGDRPARARGTVTSVKQGYGFVRPDAKPGVRKVKGPKGDLSVSFSDVISQGSLIKGNRIEYEIVPTKRGSKHAVKLQSVVVLDDEGVLGRLGLQHLAPLLASEQIDDETLPLLSVEDLLEVGVSEADARRIAVAAAAPPPRPPPSPGSPAQDRTLAEAKEAVLRLMKDNKRLREALATAESSRAEELTAAAAASYKGERAANRSALENLELMKRERESAVRALAEESARHAATRNNVERELAARGEKAAAQAGLFTRELEDAVRALGDEKRAHAATMQHLAAISLRGRDLAAHDGGLAKMLAQEQAAHALTKQELTAMRHALEVDYVLRPVTGAVTPTQSTDDAGPPAVVELD